MKIYADKLEGRLKQGLAPVYLVAGDEPLQVEESLTAIRDTATAAGYTERERFFVERGFDWNDFHAAGASLSLFSSRKLIELRLPRGKPGDEGAKILKEYCANLPEDVVLVVISAKVDQRASWVKALDAVGVFVTVWPIDAGRLPQWINQRLRSRGLRADGEAVRLIADRVEGNLLAAAQEVEKLLLLCGPGELDYEAARRAVADSARFDVFGLVDSALAGEANRTRRNLEGLRGEGFEPPLVVWAITREIRDLAKRASREPGGAVSMQGVWEKRKPLVVAALQRHARRDWLRFLQHAARIDRVMKGQASGDVWRELTDLLLAIAGRTPGRRVA